MFSVYERNETVIVKKIDECLEKDWEEREKYWISFYKKEGFNLLNIDEGGKGVITLEKRTTDSITRSIKGHEKPIIALNKDGSFYKRFDSCTKASQELGLKSKSSINNVLSGRSKSAAGYLWVYEANYDDTITYEYSPTHRGIYVYEFDIDGILLNKYPSKRSFNKLEGWSFNGIQEAIRNKTVYHDHYWSDTPEINVDEFEPYFNYSEINFNGDIIELYRTQIEICEKFNMSASQVCTYIKNNTVFPNGNKISKL